MIIKLFLRLCKLTLDKSFNFPLQPLAVIHVHLFSHTNGAGLMRSLLLYVLQGPPMEKHLVGRTNVIALLLFPKT